MAKEQIIIIRQPNHQNLELVARIVQSDTVESLTITIILIQDGVYYVRSTPHELRSSQHSVTILALKEDVLARGLQNQLVSEIQQIDYEEMVDVLMRSNKNLISLA
ncbi:MAG: sulfurtransferase complex subunit TusB [Candidatus Thorarchaeota archaeon]